MSGYEVNEITPCRSYRYLITEMNPDVCCRWHSERGSIWITPTKEWYQESENRMNPNWVIFDEDEDMK